MKEVYGKGELAKQILLCFAVTGAVVTFAVFPGLGHILRVFDPKDKKQKDKLYQSLRRLEKSGHLKRRYKNGAEEVVLTEKGKKKVTGYLLEDVRIPEQRVWDKKWRVVMFDIPEPRSRARREMCWKLKDMGMKAVQYSVFISPYPCKEAVDDVSAFYDIDAYVMYLEADYIEGVVELKKHFKLS